MENKFKKSKIILASSSPFRAELLEKAGVIVSRETARIDERSLEQFLKSGNRFSDKNCGKNKDLEQSVELSKTKNVLEKDFDFISPRELALKLASAKAKEVSWRFSNDFIIGCDQILSFKGKIFHKVKNWDEARQRLQILSGKTHFLHTAVTVYQNENCLWQKIEKAKLTMRSLSDQLIENYLKQVDDSVLATAGICQIEGLGIRLFKRIKGDYHAIIGLPLLPLLNFLSGKGLLDE